MKGLKVEHDMASFKEGKTVILTLKDKGRSSIGWYLEVALKENARYYYYYTECFSKGMKDDRERLQM